MNNVIEIINNKIEDNATIIISCSGGPDSMCLMDTLNRLKEEKKFKLVCAHVNHGVREESKEEEVFVRNYCLNNNIEFEVLTIKKYNGNFHNNARVLRYNFLKEMCSKYDSKYCLTAHHGDDLVETILMRISRGSNISGYIGFKSINISKSYTTVRPLIFLTKEDILTYNKSNNIEYRLDESNNSLEYTRNKYRHLVLPSLKKIDNLIHLKFLNFSEKINEYDEFVKGYIIKCDIVNDLYINVRSYLEADEFIKRKSIELYISKIQSENEFYVTDKIIFEIEKLLKSSKGKATIDLPNDFIGKKEKNQFYIEKRNNVL